MICCFGLIPESILDLRERQKRIYRYFQTELNSHMVKETTFPPLPLA